MAINKQIVENYGLHQNKADGIWWLIQQTEGLNSLGLPNKQCPFRLKSNLLMCPHKVDLSVPSGELRQEWQRVDMMMEKSKLLKFFDPAQIPEIKTIYVETDDVKDYHAITLMQSLLNPCITVANAAGMVKDSKEQVVRRLRSSNLSTYFIYNINSSNLNLMIDIATAASMQKCRLVFAGPRLPFPDMGNVLTRLPFDKNAAQLVTELGDEKMRKVGAIRLKRFMRT